MKKVKLIGFVLLALLGAGATIGYFMYNKPHRSAADEKGIIVTAQQLCTDYEADETASDKKYIGQLLELSGTITEVGTNQENNSVVMLACGESGGVQCTFDKVETGLIKGETVVIKGFCTGYLLPDVKLNRCILKRE
jgi:hypothetical protein